MLSFLFLALAALAPGPLAAADENARLKQAAQHFADMEDDEAQVILLALSEEGNADADVLLGYLYADPLYEGRDYEKAVVAFKKAAASGNREAMFQLAEARFWPDYSEWNLSPEEEEIRLTSEEVLNRLQQVKDDDHFAARWRLAHLCTFGGHDCGTEATDKAINNARWTLGNLRMIGGANIALSILRSEEADSPKNAESLRAHLALGLADADPFVADVFSDSFWWDVESSEQCPEPESFAVAGRLLAAEGHAVSKHEGRLDLEDCFSVEQLLALRTDLVSSLDRLARAYGNQNNWHLQTCYQNPEAPTFGDCLIHAVRHHYFACTKLSMIDHFRRRYDIYYASSDRYARCREHMLSARD